MPSHLAARPATRRRAPQLALAAAALLALAAPPARAQPVTLDFNGLTAVDASGIRLVDNCYTESGFRVSLASMPCGAPAALGSWTPDNDLYYTGTPALFNNFEGALDVAATNGRVFSLHSIGLAPFLGALGNPTTVLFTGFRAGGGVLTRSVDVPGGDFFTPASLTAFTFSDWDGLLSLRLTVTSPDVEPYVQLDDVALTAAPEPATVLLLAGGLLGVGALARRRGALRGAR
jgi:hypothetical protein